MSDDPGKTHYYGDDCIPPHLPPDRSPVGEYSGLAAEQFLDAPPPQPGSVQRSDESLQEALAAAEDAMIKYLVVKSQELQPDGCCQGPDWRGHLCQYHQGYADGVSAMYDRAFGPL
jgi:hypothetical protein